MSIVIHWFRQDLRLADNEALAEAASTGEVLPIYILEDVNSGKHKMGAASRVWLASSLQKLNDSLGGRLQVFSGDAKEIIKGLCDKHKIEAVFWNRCYEPWRIRRDKQIKQYLLENNIQAESFNGSLLIEPWESLKEDGSPYKVFTPFYKKNYMQSGFEPNVPLPAPKGVSFAMIKNPTNIDDLALLPDLPWKDKMMQGWKVGEAAAAKRLQDFLKNGINNYKEGRNYPAKQNVSRLSPHLHFGEISPRQVWSQAQASSSGANLECFLSELCWREFSYYLLYHFPDLPEKNFQEKFDQFPWQKNKENLERWQKGKTGIPIVDAGMRELWQTGYMHNRVRMIVASFLVKNLRIDWREGESWFWDCLVDADLASNSASWQWVAGSGADAAPYFRVFNPVLQGQKFDPDGKYTKKYVPELKNLSNKYLFNPWEAPDEILKKAGIELGKNYPKPIIDIKESRDKALAAYNFIRNK